MNTTNWLATGAIGGLLIGLVTGLWSKIKFFAWRLCSFFVSYVEILDESTSKAILNYLIETYPRSKWYDRSYSGLYEHTRQGKYGLIPYEDLASKSVIFWSGWKPLVFGANRQQNNSNGQQQNGWYASSSNPKKVEKVLMFFRGTFDVEDIIKKAVTARNEICWASNKNKNARRRFFIKKIPDPSKKTGTSSSDSGYTVGTGIAWYYESSNRLLQHERNELGRQLPGNKSAMDSLIFPDRIKNLIREIQIWRNHRDWFIERGIPWKRGWILYGPPGTGKTALVRAFAEDEDMPLFIFSLGEMMNAELEKSWAEMQAHTPCIALCEDIDNVFHGRTNVWNRDMNPFSLLKDKPKQQKPAEHSDDDSDEKSGYRVGMLSFDCLLNCIDGAGKEQGVFTVLTTNFIDKIDEALGKPRQLPDGSLEFISSRPGRIDKAIELTYMEREDKKEMAKRILWDYQDGLKLMMEFVDKWGDELKETPAQFQERCSQLAQSYFWEEISKKEGIKCVAASEVRQKIFQVVEGQKVEKRNGLSVGLNITKLKG